ncbi:intracellular protein transport protein uso1-like [Nicotiana tomentosiformis]|uniref:intracellular protein transport protein uso1-like n=1 Tax=Nicotiana tomentosiformis TaxID=4098 RepID=UPI00388CDA29
MEEEIKDLRAELAKAYQDQTDLTEQVMIILKTHGLASGTVDNISISQMQQKLEVVGKLHEEVDMIRAETLGWKYGMDHLAVDKETARAQLSSAETQLQDMKEKSSVQASKIEELEARLASELAKAKSDAKKAKANADAFVAVYRANAEAAQEQAREAAETAKARAHWVAELAKCRSRRETLEEIHSRGFDLTEEIKRAKELKADAEALASNDDDDDDRSKSGSESGEELDREETAPGDNQES